MNILIYGIGGVGGYFGGKLAQTRQHVTFIARGAHLQAIRESGLQVKSIYGDFRVSPSLATDNPMEAPPPDLVILAVKSWQVEEAMAQLLPCLTERTVVLPLQNGVVAFEQLAKSINSQQVLGGLCRIISYIEAPGKIHHKAFHPQILFGEQDGADTPRLQQLKAVFDAAGVDARISETIELEMWRKFLFIATISGIGALTRSEIGLIRSDEYLRSLMLQTAGEITAVACAKDVSLGTTDIEQVFAAIDAQAPDTTASMQRDLMAGNPSELETFNGYIAQEGEKYSVATPITTCIYRCLLPMERKARGLL